MKTYKVVQVGCGGMSHAWTDIAINRPDMDIVGLVDINRDTADKSAEKHGLPASIVFPTLEEALATTRPDIVFDVTIPESHHQVVMTALQSGCHVFGEKPLADTLDHAREMVNAAKSAGKLYAVMQNRRYESNMRSFATGAKDGTIGDISTVNADFYVAPHFGGFRDAIESPLLLDMAIHTFDQARCISGADPVAVYCHEYNPKGSWYKGNASAVCVFEMTDGIVFTYRGSWCAEGLNTSWEAHWRVQGSKGSATWEGGDNIKAEVVVALEGYSSKCDEVPLPRVNVPLIGHEGCVDAMMTALHNGAEPETICSDNIKSLAMVFAAIESAKAKQRVEIRI